MLLDEIKNIKSEKRDLRNFGITFFIVFGILGTALWWKGKDTYLVFLVLSSVFLFLGFALPNFLKPFQKVWMVFAVILGWVMTRLILSILFYIVFSFIRLISRIFGKKFLDLKMDRSKNSFWIIRHNKEFKKSDYERQF